MDAVFFDMDGVLVDSEEQWRKTEVPIFRKMIPSWTERDQKRLVGMGDKNIYKLLVSEYGLTLSPREYLSICEKAADDIYLKRVSRTEGFPELIAELRGRGVHVGLVSSSSWRTIRMVLDRFDLGPLFASVVSADDVGGEGKPSPAIYLHAAGLAGARPARCVAIEDSVNGVTAAKRAGMACIGYRNGANHDQDLSETDMEVSSFAELSWARMKGLLR